MLCKPAVITLAFAAVASAAAVPSTHAVHEERHAPSAQWIKRGRVPHDSVFPVRIGLAQNNLHNGHAYLMDVADPDSPRYGQHWTSEQVIDAFKPSQETVDAVREWLTSAGIPESSITHSDNKGWFAFDASVGTVEELLHTEYHEYEDSISGGILPSCDRYHVPKHIQEHVDYITPGLKLLAPDTLPKRGLQKRVSPSMRKRLDPALHTLLAADKSDLTRCDQAVTPQCIAALYKIPPAGLNPNHKNKLGIYESALTYWDQQDLDEFFTMITSIPNGTHPKNISIDGAIAWTEYQEVGVGQATLDLEAAYPIIYPQSIAIYDENDLNYQFPFALQKYGFNQLLDSIDGSYCTYTAYGETGDAEGIDPSYPDPQPYGGYPYTGYNGTLQCGVYKAPNVLSISYGNQEAALPIAYQKRQCNEFLKLGLQGVSFVFTSGSNGVGQSIETGATDCLGKKDNIFNPGWPQTCPYVTTVGATKIYPGNSVLESQPESVAFDTFYDPYNPPISLYLNYSTGGGFSNIYPTPDYQKQAVAAYFKQHNPPYRSYDQLAAVAPNPATINIDELRGNTHGLYNRAGRGYPDVAANGDNTFIVAGGQITTSSGESAAAPIFASIINRIVEERLAVGKGPLGFLNPTLYKNPGMFNDVTNGSNIGCQSPGFKAVPGWDPASGLGTPIYPKMLETFLGLP